MSESGLKQRRVNAANISNNSEKNEQDDDGIGGDGSGSKENNTNERKNNDDYDEDEYDNDSKETRLTLMEEILLLGLKDREVLYQLKFISFD
jgi:hypothetical protein